MMTMATLPADETLIHAFLDQGDKSAFAELYGRYQNIVYGKCLSMLKDNEWAADVAQDIFVKLYFVLPSFAGKSTFKTWLYRIVHNQCLSAIERERKVTYDDEILVDKPSKDETPKELTDHELNSDLVRKTLHRLSPAEAEILLLKYDDLLSLDEVCEILNIAKSAAKMRLLRAREKFKQFYAEYDVPMISLLAVLLTSLFL